MQTVSYLISICFLVCLGAGCSTRTPSSRDSDHYLNAPHGYLRVRDVEPKDIRHVLTHVAEAKRWERTSNEERGSYDPVTKDDFVRSTHVYRDQAGHDIRVDWVWERGHDTLFLISTDPKIRKPVSTAIGVNILRQQQGLPLLAD